MSNTQTKNVPELRFPGFEGEWEENYSKEVTPVPMPNTEVKLLSVDGSRTYVPLE